MTTWHTGAWLGPALLGVIVGLAAGAVFYGGLACTVARLSGARRPGLLMAGSLLVRLAAVAGALLIVARWLPPAGVLGAAFGLLVSRTVLVRAAAVTAAGPRSQAAARPAERR
jgi:F1F0 ATPase subunit 2